MGKVLRNEAKLELLVTLDLSIGPMTLRELSRGFEQKLGSLYVYCARLKRQGLIQAMYDRNGRLAYYLTRKGRERLAWLRQRAISRGLGRNGEGF